MPRISAQAKEDNRRRILEAASEMFREQGVDQVGIDQLMQHAGLTRGGFYNHFESKEALVAEACKATFTGALTELRGLLQALGDVGPCPGAADVGPGDVKSRGDASEVLEAIVDHYLSAGHRDAPSDGCPTATLAVDIGRHSVLAQQPYAEGIRAYLTVLAELLTRSGGADATGTDPDVGVRATELLSGLVGTMVLARAVRSADPALSEEILCAGRRTAAAAIGASRAGVAH